jgi:hypothetical protein
MAMSGNAGLQWGAFCAGAVLLLSPLPAPAFKFDLGSGFSGSFDSTVSFGMAMRMSNRSCARIGRDNGGCAALGAELPEASADAFFLNGDDGDLNYSNHQLIDAVAKGTHELYLKAPDGWSVFARITELYDPAIGETRRTDLASEAKRFSVYNVQPLDAYVNKDFDWLGRSARIRAGNQVISWGEDFFVLGGINYVNAYDVRRAHVPGTQVKEILRPSPMLSLNTDVVEDVSLETYYQWHWQSYMLDPAGTYFSTADVVGKGNTGAIFIPTSALNQQLSQYAGLLSLAGLNSRLAYGTVGDPGGTGLTAAQLGSARFVGPRIATGLLPPNARPLQKLIANVAVAAALPTGTVIPLVSDAGAPNSGQYGAALRYHADWVDGDFGLYYEHYNEKIPFVTYTVDATLAAYNPLSAGYRIEYPTNRKLYGLSFSTNIGEWAFGSELSYRPNQAVGIDTSVPSGKDPKSAKFACANGGGEAAGKYCKGWVDEADYQVDVSALQIFSPNDGLGRWILPALGASEGDLIVEAGGTYYPDISPLDGTPWSLPAYTLPSKLSTGFVTEMVVTYPDAFGLGFNWSPQIDYSQGIAGNSPNAIPWQQGVKAATLSLNLNRNNAITTGLAYTWYWGGGDKNLLGDRDFLSLNVAYNF